MAIRKHKGINQTTGKLKPGYKYSGKKLKSGLPQIVKVQKKTQKGGGGRFPSPINKNNRFKRPSPVKRSKSNERFGRLTPPQKPCFDYQPVCKGTDVDIWNERCDKRSNLRYNKRVEKVANSCANGRIKHRRCRLERGLGIDEGHDGAIEKMLKKANHCRGIVDDQIVWLNRNIDRPYKVKKVRSAPGSSAKRRFFRDTSKGRKKDSPKNWRRGNN